MKDKKNYPKTSKPENNFTQINTGGGANIGVINNSITQKLLFIDSLSKFHDVFTSLRHKKTRKAKEQFKLLKSYSNLDSDFEFAFKVVSIHIGIKEKTLPPDSYQTLISISQISNNEHITNWCLSGLIQIDILNDNPDVAKQRYQDFISPNTYLLETYYELIADESELKKEFDENKLNLDDIILNGLIRGAMRTQSDDFSLLVVTHLNDINPCFNSQVLLLFSSVNHVFREIGNSDYWMISLRLKKEVEKITEQLIPMIKESCEEDIRVLDLAIQLIDYTRFDDKNLIRVCYRFLDEVKAINPNIAAHILFIKEQDLSELNKTTSTIIKSKEDSSYKNGVIQNIITSKTISDEDAYVLSNCGKDKEILNWLDSGGLVKSDNDFVKDLSLLELEVISCNDNPVNKSKIIAKLESFFKKHDTNLSSLNPVHIIPSTQKLYELNLSFYACKFLKPLIPSKDLWLSPLIDVYLINLHKAKQMKTLISVIDNIDETEWNEFIWQFNTERLHIDGKLPEAIVLSQDVLKKYPLSILNWLNCVQLMKGHRDFELKIHETLKRVPKEIFETFSESAVELLYEFYLVGEINFFENQIVSWFIQNPIACSKPLSNLWLQMILNKNINLIPSMSVALCKSGVVYQIDGEEKIKLIVPDNTDLNDYLIKETSDLGKLLLTLDIGTIENYGLNEIELLVRQPPLLCVFKLAEKIRNNIKDGCDCFNVFKTPDNEKDILPFIEKKLQLNKDNQKDEDILKSPKVPLFIKGFKLGGHEVVETAIKYFVSENVFKNGFSNIGDIQAEEVILDVYSIIYLSLTGLIYGMDLVSVKYYITNETNCYLQNWIKKINDRNYLSIGLHPDGGIFKTTYKEIQEETYEIQKAIKLAIDVSQVVNPEAVDLPVEIINIEEFVDPSLFSTLKLYYSKKYHWLCVDSDFLMLINGLDLPQLNVNNFLIDIGQTLSIEKKQIGIFLHANTNLPYALTFEDITLLSQSKEEYAPYFIKKILEKHSSAFISTQGNISFLINIFRNVIANTFLNKESNKYFDEATNLEIFNLCCNIIVKSDENNKSELKLGIFFFNLISFFKQIPEISNFIIKCSSDFITSNKLDETEVNNIVNKLIVNQQTNISKILDQEK